MEMGNGIMHSYSALIPLMIGRVCGLFLVVGEASRGAAYPLSLFGGCFEDGLGMGGA